MSYSPSWGRPTLFLLGTEPPETFPTTHTPAGPTCRLTFGRELVCELRPGNRRQLAFRPAPVAGRAGRCPSHG